MLIEELLELVHKLALLGVIVARSPIHFLRTSDRSPFSGRLRGYSPACLASRESANPDANRGRPPLMCANRLPWMAVVVLGLIPIGAPTASASEPTIRIATPMPPPAWALLERELLRANVAACREFYDKYFDERGFLLCVERWGGDDGPDDAIEN